MKIRTVFRFAKRGLGGYYWKPGAQSPMSDHVIHSDPEILGGMPVFVGTRVPFHALVDYIEGGYTLDVFLEHFPTVTREQAVQALEYAKELTLADARTAG
jgi:uncharacterized protein (DUF433 family)